MTYICIATIVLIDVIEDVESGNWLDGDCNHSRRQCRTDPVAQGGGYAL